MILKQHFKHILKESILFGESPHIIEQTLFLEISLVRYISDLLFELRYLIPEVILVKTIRCRVFLLIFFMMNGLRFLQRLIDAAFWKDSVLVE